MKVQGTSEKNVSIVERVMKRFAEDIDVPPDFQGDPEVHGIDKPRGGGFSIMQNLQKDLVKEEVKEDEKAKEARIASRVIERFTHHEDVKIANTNLRKVSMREAAVKEAMYWCSPDRTYRLTKKEQAEGTAVCPKCKSQMEKESFTKQEKMFRCPDCGFKVPTGKVTTKKIEIEIEPDGEVEVEVTTASRRQK